MFRLENSHKFRQIEWPTIFLNFELQSSIRIDNLLKVSNFEPLKNQPLNFQKEAKLRSVPEAGNASKVHLVRLPINPRDNLFAHHRSQGHQEGRERRSVRIRMSLGFSDQRERDSRE